MQTHKAWKTCKIQILWRGSQPAHGLKVALYFVSISARMNCLNWSSRMHLMNSLNEYVDDKVPQAKFHAALKPNFYRTKEQTSYIGPIKWVVRSFRLANIVYLMNTVNSVNLFSVIIREIQWRCLVALHSDLMILTLTISLPLWIICVDGGSALFGGVSTMVGVSGEQSPGCLFLTFAVTRSIELSDLRRVFSYSSSTPWWVLFCPVNCARESWIIDLVWKI